MQNLRYLTITELKVLIEESTADKRPSWNERLVISEKNMPIIAKKIKPRLWNQLNQLSYQALKEFVALEWLGHDLYYKDDPKSFNYYVRAVSYIPRNSYHVDKKEALMMDMVAVSTGRLFRNLILASQKLKLDI